MLDILTLRKLNLDQWRQSSYIGHLIGLLSPWRDGSWLLQWSDVLGALLISIIFLVAPFLSTTLIGIILLAIGVYWLLITISEPNKYGSTPIHLLVLLYWGISTVALGFSPVKKAAFNGWLELTLYLIFFALTARILRVSKLRSWLITLILHVGLIVSVYGVRQEFFGAEQLATWNDPTSDLANDTRVYSYLGNPNLLAGYLLTAIAFSMGAIIIWKGWLPKALAITIFITNSACLYFTDSRGGWIGMMALMMVFLLLLRVWFHDYIPRFWQKWLVPIVLGVLAMLLVVGLLVVEPLRIRILSIFAGREDSSNNFRINVWSAVLEMIRDRPIIGIGSGNDAFNKIYPLYMRPRFTALGAYCIYLEIAVETGLIGLSCFLWLLFVTFNQGIKQLNQYRQDQNLQGVWMICAMAAMGGLLAHGFVDTVWYRPQINTLWWFSIATIASYYPTKITPKNAVTQ